MAALEGVLRDFYIRLRLENYTKPWSVSNGDLGKSETNQGRLIPMLVAIGMFCPLVSCPGQMKMNSEKKVMPLTVILAFVIYSGTSSGCYSNILAFNV